VVDPAVRVPQSTLELPAAAWNTWLLLNVGDAADWDAVKATWPSETHDVDDAEPAQLAPSKKLTETVRSADVGLAGRCELQLRYQGVRTAASVRAEETIEIAGIESKPVRGIESEREIAVAQRSGLRPVGAQTRNASGARTKTATQVPGAQAMGASCSS